jgi:hypothetical protein
MHVVARNTFLGFLIVAVIAAALLALGGPSSAANGSNLRQIIADRTGTQCASVNEAGDHRSVGVGIAFDGVNLLISCYSDNTITAVSPLNGAQVLKYTVTGASNLGALAWDSGRNVIWACSSFSGVGTINPVTHVFTSKFSTPGCFDGLAYDGADDSVWTSPDATGSITHTSAGGTFINTKSVSIPNSGIAVGGSLLFLADNGNSNIWTSPKDLSALTKFASFPRRLEDMECDNISFAAQGKGAMWSIDAYDNILNAWEIPAGSCSFGGGITPTPTPSPTTPPPAVVSRAQVTATSAKCGEVVINASGVTPGLPHQIVVTPQGGGTSQTADVTAGADQKVTATFTTGGGTFTAYVRNKSNQVTVSNTEIFTVAACPAVVTTPTPTPTPVRTPTPQATPTPTPIAQLPSTTTGADGALPIALAVIALALAAMAWRRRYSGT